MKFIFADSLDHVDPRYDFIRDRYAAGRTPYWDDFYPHEIMGYAPYDGVLVSRGIVGGAAVGGKYTEAQAMRFRRVGARTFLRLDTPEFAHLPIFGDCGAFTYHKEELPPYTPEDTAEFYDDGDLRMAARSITSSSISTRTLSARPAGLRRRGGGSTLP
ncbi:hypothetical protein [Mesorhizobium sp.]|uniref:hypothetical protein n=1 Tax=Mesorhizobium sp. TaxID=1871066 RepID=UPI00257EDEF6|nr:hypothetical protein [Mesorhizobium sp.]